MQEKKQYRFGAIRVQKKEVRLRCYEWKSVLPTDPQRIRRELFLDEFPAVNLLFQESPPGVEFKEDLNRLKAAAAALNDLAAGIRFRRAGRAELHA